MTSSRFLTASELACRFKLLTVILNLITRAYVLQVSDLRLWDAGLEKVVEAPERPKAVIFANQAIYAYSGLAYFDGTRRPTNEWLMEALDEGARPWDLNDSDMAAKSVSRAIADLNRRATDVYQLRVSLHDDPPLHTFCSVGWGKAATAIWYPYIDVHSNQDEHFNKSSLTFRRRRHHLLTSDTYRIHEAGAALGQSERQKLHAQIHYLSQHEPEEPLKAAEALAEAVGALSSRLSSEGAPTVGSNTLVNCIPRSAAGPQLSYQDDKQEQSWEYRIAPPDMRYCTSCYFEGDDPYTTNSSLVSASVVYPLGSKTSAMHMLPLSEMNIVWKDEQM